METLAFGSQYGVDGSSTGRDSNKQESDLSRKLALTADCLVDHEFKVENVNCGEFAHKDDDERDYDGEGWSCAQVIAFQNAFFEVLEELRMKRALNDENKRLIKTLVAERQEVERKMEEVTSHSKSLSDELVDQECVLRQQYEERMQRVEDEKIFHSLACENHQKEIAVLKHEIRQLQMDKYDTERLNKELVHKLELQSHSRKVFVNQLSEMERKYCGMKKNVSELSNQLTRLDANVKAAIKLNRKLMYVNSHQECQVAAYERELQSRSTEIVSLRVELANNGRNTSTQRTKGKLQVCQLHRQRTKTTTRLE
ncbi:protein Spindly-like [Corticium candelabrum]|uniref:protein Spindly-like n=1 Tax=Corticium candelabrum TaxID=121492 RepID=UPI002E27713C|nr:protein Spindly-like [Corticium candelabrum]